MKWMIDFSFYIACLANHLPSTSTVLESPLAEIRLVDGYTQWDGRVEVLHDKTWGTVCGSNWTMQDAKVSAT